MKKTNVLSALAIAACLPAMATTWYVAPAENGGDEANDGLTPSTPKRYLLTRANNATAGDTIYVIGTYTTSSTITISKQLLVAGYGPDAAISGGNTCLPLKLNASGLVVSNLVIHSGSPSGATASGWTYPAAGVEVASGTLVDCTVRNCSPQGATHTSTIYVSGAGTVLRCAITNNTAGIQTASYGAGLYIGHDSAVVKDCEIAYNRGRACAVYMTKGKITGCDIHDNRSYSASELASGASPGSGAGIRVDGGVLERSRIRDNYSYGSGGGLWLRDNAIVRYCLVYGNHAEISGGAIHANSGSPKTYHCNIGGNTAADGGAAINNAAGTPQFVNCIVFGNGNNPSDEIKTASGVTASFTYCLLPVSRSGTGNGVLVASPYRDEANGNYLTSVPLVPAIDTGSNGDGNYGTVDFLGTARPLDGNEDGTDTADIGAVEYNPASQGGALAVIVPSATQGTAPMSVSLALDLTGFDATGVTAVWDFGDGSATLTTNADAAVAHEYVLPGRFYPIAAVSDRSGHVCTTQYAQGIDARPREVFVSKTGSGTYPYDTPEKASSSIWTAYGALCPETVPGRTVTILPGEYQVSAVFTLNKPCLFRGEGPLGSVILSGRGQNSVLKVAHADAVVSNLAIRAGYSAGVESDAASASGVEITAGRVTHCEISGCAARANYSAQAVTLAGTSSARAYLVNSVVTNNTGYVAASNPSGQYPRGAGVYMADYASVTNCLIAENRARSGAGVFLKAGASHSTLLACRVERNAALGTGGGILSFGGSIERCLVVSNYTESAGGNGGGIRILQAGKAKNCLVIGNRAHQGGGLYSSDANVTILHCTFAGNVADEASGAILDGGSIAYSIISGNSGSDDLAFGSGSITYSCTPSPTAGTGNIAADPMFRDAAAGDYRLAPGSPCRDAAVATAVNNYFTGVDIDYASRPVDSDGDGTALPDMGCYEMPYEEAAPALSIQSSRVFGSPENLFTFTARTTGFTSGAETAFTWDFGDGSQPYVSGSTPSATHQFAAGGPHTVSVRVVDDGQGIDLSASMSVAIRVPETFVSHEGSDTPPYDTPARAATSLGRAFEYTYAPSGGTGRVHIAEGVYSERASQFDVNSRIEITGKGRGRTFVSGARFSLGNAGARLAGVTITNVQFNLFAVKVAQGTFADAEISSYTAEGNACGLILDGLHSPAAGKVCLATNVLVRGCAVTKNGNTVPGGAGVRMLNGAWLVDSTVRDCTSEGDGAGVYVSGTSATNAVLRCRVTGNRATGTERRGGGLHAGDNTFVRIEDTVFDGNESGGCGAISITGKTREATLLRLVVTNNVCNTYAGAGIRSDATNVVVAGCLIRDNVRVSDTGNCAGLFLWHGRAVNCTITGNCGGAGAAGVLLYGDDALLLNCIVCGNVPNSYTTHPEVAPTSGVTPAITNLLTTAAIPWAAAGVVVADDPRLRQDGSPRGNSPAVDAGGTSFWNPAWGLVDLGGDKRVRGRSIDLGCFEYASRHLILYAR